MLEFRPAVRKAVPLIMSIASVSGGGKTYSALLLAAGLAKPGQRVGMIDTENERGLLYADSPGIQAAYREFVTPECPNGYYILNLDAPFSPARYIEAINTAESFGIDVLIIDSGSHEWEGTGGCAEMAERDKGRWNKAKIANRKYVYRLLYSTMHIIVCLRAREKSKIVPKSESVSGKEETISLGIQPVAEKNFVFEMLVSLQLDEITHHAVPLKVPEPLLPLFGARLITKQDGARIREWNEKGSVMDPSERLRKQARAAALDGMASYEAFYGGLPAAQKKVIFDTDHADNKRVANQADEARKMAESDDEKTYQPAAGREPGEGE